MNDFNNKADNLSVFIKESEEELEKFIPVFEKLFYEKKSIDVLGTADVGWLTGFKDFYNIKLVAFHIYDPIKGELVYVPIYLGENKSNFEEIFSKYKEQVKEEKDTFVYSILSGSKSDNGCDFYYVEYLEGDYKSFTCYFNKDKDILELQKKNSTTVKEKGITELYKSYELLEEGTNILPLVIPIVDINNNSEKKAGVLLVATGDSLDVIKDVIFDPASFFSAKIVINRFVRAVIEIVYKYYYIKTSIKSAIAAIMSRNMSHNLGSHVLSSLAYNINMPYDDVILYKYLQHRMDFIAQITTDWPQWTYPVWFVRDLMRKFYTQTHVLNYIVESEDLSAYEFQSNVPEETQKEQEDKLVIEIEKHGLEEKIIRADGDSQNYSLNHDTDVQLAIPGGTVGYHAFYVILENIIRNSAKHEWSGISKAIDENDEQYKNRQRDKYKNFIKSLVKQEKEKDVEFRKKPDDEKTNKIDAEANSKFENKNIEQIIDHNKELKNLTVTVRFYDEKDKDYTRFEIFSEVKTPFAKELATEINNKLTKGFITEERGDLIHQNWGLAEMKIALGFLNKLEPYDIGRNNKDIILEEGRDNSDENPVGIGLIKAKASEDKFGYEFIIPKPKEVLIIVSKEEFNRKFNEKLCNELKKFNIHLVDRLETNNLDYELVVIQNHELINKIQADDELISFLPNRILLVTQEKINIKNRHRLFSITVKDYSKIADVCFNFEGGNQQLGKANDLKFKLFSHWMFEYIGKPDVNNKVYLHGETKGESTNKSDNTNIKKIVKKYEQIFETNIQNKENNFKQKVTDKVRNFTNNNSSLQHIIRNYRNNVKNILKDFSRFIFSKYDEDIQTLPKAYRASQVGDATCDSEQLDIFDKEILNERINYINDLEINSLDANVKKNLIYLKRHATLNKGYYYSEALSGAQNYFNLLINGDQGSADYLNKKVMIQILENAYSGILIIDERVHEYISMASDEVKNQLGCANIFAYDDKKIHNIKDITSIIENNSEYKNKIKFLIIHQGIIDKGSDKGSIDQSLRSLQSKVPYVIITSGRGRPDKLPKGFKFIPYSTIADTVMKPYHEKFLLTNILLKLTNYGKQ